MYVYTHIIQLAVHFEVEEFLVSIAVASVHCSESIPPVMRIPLFTWNMLFLCHNIDGSQSNSTEWKCFAVVALFHLVDQIDNYD
jgi:hypothetical protein